MYLRNSSLDDLHIQVIYPVSWPVINIRVKHFSSGKISPCCQDLIYDSLKGSSQTCTKAEVYVQKPLPIMMPDKPIIPYFKHLTFGEFCAHFFRDKAWSLYIDTFYSSFNYYPDIEVIKIHIHMTCPRPLLPPRVWYSYKLMISGFCKYK